MKKQILFLVFASLLSGCEIYTQKQTVRQSENQIVQPEEPGKSQEIRKMIIQRGKEIFMFDRLLAHEGTLFNTMDLYTIAYRRDGKLLGVINERESGLLFESQNHVDGNQDEGTGSKDYTYIRLVREPFVPEEGVNEFPRKDIVFYLDPQYPEDAFVSVQDPHKLDEWKIYQVKDYGVWLKKQIDLELQLSKGF